MSQYLPWKFHRVTGAVAMASTLAPAARFEIIAIKLHLSAAGGTAEDFTATVDATTGAAYDQLVLAVDMETTTDVVQIYDPALPFENGDEIDFAYTNTNTKTYGLEVVYRTG